METLVQLLEKLSLCPGPSGGEDEVAAIIRSRLPAGVHVQRDGLGSLLAELPGSSTTPRIMIAAHMDEIGFMVQNITREGYLRLVALGGWTACQLPGQRLLVLGANGPVEGIVGTIPPHFQKEQKNEIKIEDLLLDVGAFSSDEVAAMGLRLGDLVTPVSNVKPYNGKLLAGKAWDDRVGCAILVEAMNRVRNHPNTIVAAATVQEEIGIRGAVTAVEVAKPHAAIVLEGGPADDTPGVARDTPQGVLGKGVQIRLHDPSTLFHRRFWQWVASLAEQEKIPYQLLVRQSGATDARAIHLAQGGIPTVALSVPVRYAHAHTGLIHLDDVDAALHLVLAILERLDDTVLASMRPS